MDEFVNADTIAAGLSGLHPERVAFKAGRLMLGRIAALAARHVSFAFETTLATRGFAALLTRLHAESYRSHVVFLSLPSPEIAIARVQERIARGGHDVPPDVVRRRFFRGLRAFFALVKSGTGADFAARSIVRATQDGEIRGRAIPVRHGKCVRRGVGKTWARACNLGNAGQLVKKAPQSRVDLGRLQAYPTFDANLVPNRSAPVPDFPADC